MQGLEFMSETQRADKCQIGMGRLGLFPDNDLLAIVADFETRFDGEGRLVDIKRGDAKLSGEGDEI